MLLSILNIFIGIPLTLDWIILYQIVTLLLLGFGYRFIHPIFTFITSLVLLILTYFDLNFSQLFTLPASWFSPLEEKVLSSSINSSQFSYRTFIIIKYYLVLHVGDMAKFIPRFLSTKRGKLVATYRMTPLWLVPLLFVIPGEADHFLNGGQFFQLEMNSILSFYLF